MALCQPELEDDMNEMPVLQATHKPDWGDVERMAENLARMVQLEGVPDLIVGLETGGAYVAAMLKRLLGVPHMVVLDVAVHDGDYRLGKIAHLVPELVEGKKVLCVDDSFDRGILLGELTERIWRLRGTAWPAALVRIGERADLSPGKPLHRVLYPYQLQQNPSWPWKAIPQMA